MSVVQVVVYRERRNNLASHDRPRREMEARPGREEDAGFLKQTSSWRRAVNGI